MEFGKNLTFQWNKSGNVDRSFDGATGTFTAPVSGRYSFGLFMTVQNGPRGYYYMWFRPEFSRDQVFSDSTSGQHKS